MKAFFKKNKLFAMYLMGSLLSSSTQFHAGNPLAALAILAFALLVFFYLYHITRK